MSNPIITQIVEQVNDLPDNLEQQVLTFVLTLRQEQLQKSGDAWDVLESLTGTVEVPAGWSAEHDDYLCSTPKYSNLVMTSKRLFLDDRLYSLHV